MDRVLIVVVLTNFTADSKSLSQLKLPIQQDSSVFGLLTPTAALFSSIHGFPRQEYWSWLAIPFPS